MKDLKEIMDGFLKIQKAMVINPALETLSNPVCGITNGRQVDRFFLYSSQPNIYRSRPYAWFELDSETGKIMKYLSCEVEDFAQKLNIPCGTMMNYQLPENLSVKELLSKTKQLQELYEKIRKFAFQNKLKPEEEILLNKYLEIHKLLTPSEITTFYYQLSPEFYNWISLVKKS